MSQQSKLRQSRDQWKEKAGCRAESIRYQSKELKRVKAERDRLKRDLKEARARLNQRESQVVVIESKVDLVFLALELFLVARIGFRAVSRVLGIVAGALGIKKSPMPSDHHQLGDKALFGAHPVGLDARGAASSAGAVFKRSYLDDRHEHCSGNGKDPCRPLP